jgi:transcriptional regulator with XRE-family HTH domain
MKMTWLKIYRLASGLTQQQIEKKSKVKRWKFSLAERGEITLSTQELKRLSNVLNMPSDALVGELSSGQGKSQI